MNNENNLNSVENNVGLDNVANQNNNVNSEMTNEVPVADNSVIENNVLEPSTETMDNSINNDVTNNMVSEPIVEENSEPINQEIGVVNNTDEVNTIQNPVNEVPNENNKVNQNESTDEQISDNNNKSIIPILMFVGVIAVIGLLVAYFMVIKDYKSLSNYEVLCSLKSFIIR